MKNVLMATMFALALVSMTISSSAQQPPQGRAERARDEVGQRNDISATNPTQEPLATWTEPTSTTVTVTTTPLKQDSRHNQTKADLSGKSASKDDRLRCARNDYCQPRSLYNNEWDQIFGPAYDLAH